MNDREIVALFWERNEEAIRETDRRYGAGLTALARRVLRDNEETQDIHPPVYLYGLD